MSFFTLWVILTHKFDFILKTRHIQGDRRNILEAIYEVFYAKNDNKIKRNWQTKKSKWHSSNKTKSLIENIEWWSSKALLYVLWNEIVYWVFLWEMAFFLLMFARNFSWNISWRLIFKNFNYLNKCR